VIYFVFGLPLIAVSWFLAWTHTSPIAVYYFPPLWLGYILLTNGLCELVFRDSLIRRMRWNFLLLFVFSIPLWWFFEYLNAIVQNWYYVFPDEWSPTTQIVLKTVSFSTVIPAVYSSSFFIHQLLKNRLPYWSPQMVLNRAAVFSLGVLAFVLMFLYPKIFFPLVWIAPLLVLEALNDRLGFASLLREIREGKWSLVLPFALGTLLTGFFWEMWNFYAFPKWFYTIPLFDFTRVFEMPILGYGGYIPFGLFVFTFTATAFGLTQRFGGSLTLPRF
jgi:hypothetical protein